ncbi:uncharacterized protein [Anabrus simplex]|uniref:uncharacterized protein n=1 Tax=Anabrus simplex TaxID=316456 RepID=UPI0034DDA95B
MSENLHGPKDFDNTACYYCFLKTSAILIGVLGSIVSGCLVWFVGLPILLEEGEARAVVIIFIAMYSLQCAFSTLLIFAAIIELEFLLLAWFWYNIIMFAVSDVVNTCSAKCSDVSLIIAQLISHAIWAFLIALVRRFHKRVVERRMSKQLAGTSTPAV